MRITFDRFDKELFLKVHHYTIVYHIIFNCGLLIKFSLILEYLFRRSSGMPQFDLLSLIVDCLIGCFMDKLFSRSSFYDTVCFSILASGPHLDATITSENTFRSSCVDAIIFICGPLTGMFLLF